MIWKYYALMKLAIETGGVVMAGKRQPKKKIEYSKMACTIAFLAFLFIGIWMVHRYYSLVQLAINGDSSVVPDAALPIAGISFILAPLISYLMYQAGLKNSRNKYGVSEDGQPYKERIGGDES